jgi:hypothetical protein
MALNLIHSHYRPDMVTRTSVVEPYNIRQVSPVAVARETINPFIHGIRAAGVQVGQGTAGASLGNSVPPLTAYGKDYGERVVAASRGVPAMMPTERAGAVSPNAQPQVIVQAASNPSSGAGATVTTTAMAQQPAYLKKLLTTAAAGRYRYDNQAHPRSGYFWSRIIGRQGLISSWLGKKVQFPFLLQVK